MRSVEILRSINVGSERQPVPLDESEQQVPIQRSNLEAVDLMNPWRAPQLTREEFLDAERENDVRTPTPVNSDGTLPESRREWT